MKAGQGPALVYLHGDYGLFWNEFLDKLAANFTVYAPAHPGTTPGDPDGLRALDDMWDLVLYHYELFDQLGLQSHRSWLAIHSARWSRPKSPPPIRRASASWS